MFDHITEVVYTAWTGELFMNNGGLAGNIFLDPLELHYDDLFALIQSWDVDDSHYSDESYLVYRRPQS